MISKQNQIEEMKKGRYLFKFFYMGSEQYYGSQRQNGLQTIEGNLISALNSKGYLKSVVDSGFEVASRTDKLVSARGAAFSFKTNKLPILMEINSELPRDIVIWAYSSVPEDFQSRYSAVYRHYKYVIPVYCLKEKSLVKMDIRKVKKACDKTRGRHDFVNFAKKSSDEEKTVRDLDLSVDIYKDFLIFNFKSRAFLRQQIRKIISMIIDVGANNLDMENYVDLLNPSNHASIEPADPRGLILWDINFGTEISFSLDHKSIERITEFINQEFFYHKTRSNLFQMIQHDNFGQ